MRQPVLGAPRQNLIADAVNGVLRASGATPANQFLRHMAHPAPPAPATAAPRSAGMLFDIAVTAEALGDQDAAVIALRQAVALQPLFGQAWARLAALLGAGGDEAGAADAARRAHEIAGAAVPAAPRPSGASRPEAAEHRWRDRLRGKDATASETLLRSHLLDDPLDAPALRILAETMINQGRPDEAEPMARRALDIAPGYLAARHMLAASLFDQNRDMAAIAECESLVQADPRHHAYRTLMASAYARIGDFTRALPIFDSIMREAPAQTEIWLSYAQALKSAGRKADSQKAFRHCLTLSPGNGGAYWSLQNLTSAPPTGAELAEMRAALEAPGLTPQQRFALHYALAYALEKAREYGQSFAHYAEGARIWHGVIGYDPDKPTARVRRTIALFTPDFLAARAGWGCQDPAPIFILGMPRAGSTLIEQILASHSQVEGTQELPEIGHIVRKLADAHGGGPSYPGCVARLTAGQVAELGETYVQACRIYRRTGRPYFVDKMPGNWVDTFLLHLMLPNAKIIDARRDPMANCFGAFKKYFSAGQNFSYDLEDLGRYYNDYVALMDHVDAVLPGRVHRVIYEDMVADTDGAVRKLLAYCGLPFETGCLRFWETERAVSTASSEQVRRPIFRDGLDQWRHYERWLGPLKATLEKGALHPDRQTR